MKTLIFGAGPLGSLYAHLFHKAGRDVTLLARGNHYDFIKENGVALVNEITGEKNSTKVNVINTLGEEDDYDLVIVIMRKNSVKKILPDLAKNKKIRNILFMGNNTLGFEEYLKELPAEKILFGFPGGGGSRIDHIVRYTDSDKPGGKRFPIVIGEIDGETRERTRQIQQLFESSGVQLRIVDEIDSWLKYHVIFVLPLAGAILKSGDNHKLARDKDTIRIYIESVKEGGRVLKSLGFRKSYNPRLKFFYLFPAFIIVAILKKFLDSRLADIVLMMHLHAAMDEMHELAGELKTLVKQTTVETPNLDALLGEIEKN